jgi:hypothetical protein
VEGKIGLIELKNHDLGKYHRKISPPENTTERVKCYRELAFCRILAAGLLSQTKIPLNRYKTQYTHAQVTN